ncbi:hypothetical protein MANES_14G023400v8 [Manihot esculenta]|uniref:Uncharacterized protein n=1 Tax=Manihot esculenta TaxID=3983 RepID=A0ACB7GF23_MANES|nr:hypothetical protein MANES_14G023400v8 [Manihot esculenta]
MANASKAPRKGMLGGRTPLGDLSNSVKSSLNQASKKQHSSIFSLSEKQSGVSQTALAATKKKSTSIAAGKVHTSSRKALSDISNSGKPNLNEGSKKKYNANLSVVAEELIDANTIAVEKFLHNHQECIKAQAKAMDLDKFLQTLGLDNGFSKQQANPKSTRVTAETPLRHLKLKEMTEQLFEDGSWKHKVTSKVDSPPACRTPKSPKHFMDVDYKFKLLESP